MARVHLLSGLAALSIVAVDVASTASASRPEVTVRRIGSLEGLSPPSCRDVVQTPDGFIWTCGFGGVFRFDGERAVRWRPDVLKGAESLSASPDGRLVASYLRYPLWEIDGNDVQTITRPDTGEPFMGRPTPSASYSKSGDLWIADEDNIWVRSSDVWRAISGEQFNSEPILGVMPFRGDTAFVATDSTMWIMEGTTPPRRISDGPILATRARLLDVDRGYFYSFHHCWRWSSPTLESIDGPLSDAWTVTTDRSFGEAVYVRTSSRLHSSWLPMTDHENGVWAAASVGLIHIPRPSSSAFREIDIATRIDRIGDAIEVSTWRDHFSIADADTGWSLSRSEAPPVYLLIEDGWGRVWTTTPDLGFWKREPDGSVETMAHEPYLGTYDGFRRTDGRIWLATFHGLFLTPEDGSRPQTRGGPPADWGDRWEDIYVRSVVEDAAGRLWLSNFENVCSCDADSLAAGRPVVWTCHELPGEFHVRRFFETDRGRLWAAGELRGVWVHDESGWSRHPISDDLPGPRIGDLCPSPAGGHWVTGNGFYWRVEDAPDDPTGYRRLETLGPWQGLDTVAGFNLNEDKNGDLWVSENGVTHIPASVRYDAPTDPPRVAHVATTIDGVLSEPLQPTMIRHDDNIIEIGFAALTFRDRSLLRYQTRLGSQPWREARTLNLQFVNVPFGEYDVAFRASLDGHAWSESPAVARFTIPRPWTRTWWGYLMFGVIALGVGLLTYRLRVAYLLRVAGQRTRIAMDLHDEIGAGLAAIGLVADAGAANADPNHAAGAYERISSEARQMSSSVTDLVWALRTAPDPHSLARYLASRGRALFSSSDVSFTTQFPSSWPTKPLGLDVRRNIQLIAVEAMVNAAKHSRATNVVLGFNLPPGERWTLWIEDDGVGLDASEHAEDYLSAAAGMDSMRARAAAIGADLAVEPAIAGRGTRVTVTLPADSGVRRGSWRRLLRRE